MQELLSLLAHQGILADKMQRERIIYLNPADHSHVMPFNVLSAKGDPYELAQSIIEAFRRAWPESLSEAPRFADIMLHSLMLLIKTKRTLIDLPDLLTEDTFRDGLLQQASDPDLTKFF